jgi:hypothetical protein
MKLLINADSFRMLRMVLPTQNRKAGLAVEDLAGLREGRLARSFDEERLTRGSPRQN